METLLCRGKIFDHTRFQRRQEEMGPRRNTVHGWQYQHQLGAWYKCKFSDPPSGQLHQQLCWQGLRICVLIHFLPDSYAHKNESPRSGAHLVWSASLRRRNKWEFYWSCGVWWHETKWIIPGGSTFPLLSICTGFWALVVIKSHTVSLHNIPSLRPTSPNYKHFYIS